MTRNIFFFSDPHFFHCNILKFFDYNGKKTREFDSVEEMNETMVQNWNSVAGKHDRIYVPGDVTMHYGPKFQELWSRLNGQKRLILGNHDEAKKLSKFFKKITVWRVFSDKEVKIPFTLTHIPLHPLSFKGAFNVHGHTHNNDVKDERGKIDLRYVNVSVERINYTPISMEEIQKVMYERQKQRS